MFKIQKCHTSLTYMWELVFILIYLEWYLKFQCGYKCIMYFIHFYRVHFNYDFMWYRWWLYWEIQIKCPQPHKSNACQIYPLPLPLLSRFHVTLCPPKNQFFNQNSQNLVNYYIRFDNLGCISTRWLADTFFEAWNFWSEQRLQSNTI